MEIKKCLSKSEKKSFLYFRKNLYEYKKPFKNSDEELVKQLIYRKTIFSKENFVEPIFVMENNFPIAACILIHAKNYSKHLQIAFFESKINDSKIAKEIIKYSKSICLKLSIDNIIIGMNGHVNYGLGILTNNFDKPQSFGSPHNLHYYSKIGSNLKPKVSHLVTFRDEIKNLDFQNFSKVLNRVNNNYSFRNLDLKCFKKDLEIYTSLNNEIFNEHKFYYNRSFMLDYELFKSLTYLIDASSLIFAYKEEKPIGFLLWYPDYNELVSEGKHFGMITVIKNKLIKNKIQTARILEIGVLKQHQNLGAVLGLFYECYKTISNKYKYYESSWILNENFKSKNFGLKFNSNEYKKFEVYEINLGDKNA